MIHPQVYVDRIVRADKALQSTLVPKTPRERALVVQIEKARKELKGGETGGSTTITG